MNKLSTELKHTANQHQINKNIVDYSNFSYRASPKVGAMIEIMSLVMDKPINSLFTETISDAIVDYLLNDVKNIHILSEFINNQDMDINLNKLSGFMKKLEEQEVIEINFKLF